MLHHRRMPYRCEATSVEGFIQQLAVSYLRNGYWFYVTGQIPDHKNPNAVDAKLIAKYDIDISKWARLRRKRLGWANMQYIRHDRFFVLLATRGQHKFFKAELGMIRDARRYPIHYAGYSMSFRGGHSHVRIGRVAYHDVRAQLESIALDKCAQRHFDTIAVARFAPYAPVKRQVLNLLRQVNRRRSVAGMTPLELAMIQTRRTIQRPFGKALSIVASN